MDPCRSAVARHRLAAVSVGAAASAVAAGVLARVAQDAWPPAASAPRPDDVLTGLLAWTGAALAAWLALGAVLTVLSLLPGMVGRAAARLTRAVTPRAVRAMLAVLLGTSLGGVAAAAGASAAASGLPVSPAPSAACLQGAPAASAICPTETAADPRQPPAPDPAFRPTGEVRAGDRTGGFHPTSPAKRSNPEDSRLLAPPPRLTAATTDRVTVRRGDSLWRIAARHLGPQATDAEVARAWPQWYAANRDVMGADPDLLLPGQQLRPPGQGGPA